MKILMVCLGNICRSPMAEGILRYKLEKKNISWTVDSAGIGPWHVGDPPDARAIATALAHGIDISKQRGRQISEDDFAKFDLILAMDESVYRDIQNMQNSDHDKVQLIMDFAYPGKRLNVPDPYYNDDGFEHVFELLDLATDGIINQFIEKEKTK